MDRLHLRICGLLVVSLAVFLFFACGAASAEQIKITFVDKVEVDGSSILIGDICREIEGAQLTENQIGIIRSLRLKTSPLVGRPPVVIDAVLLGIH